MRANRFRGETNLSARQIAQLLRGSGLVEEEHVEWKLAELLDQPGVHFPPKLSPRMIYEQYHAQWLANLEALSGKLLRKRPRNKQ